MTIDGYSRRRFIAMTALAAAAPPHIGKAGVEAPPIEVVDAPSNLGLRPLRPGHLPGARRAPAALRRRGLLARIGARDGGEVAAPSYTTDVDEATGYRNGAGLAQYTPALAARVGAAVDGGAFCLVLGGDCSVLLGAALALRRRGRFGLLFVDGHTDFYFPRAPRPLAAAGMDLALVSGHGPAGLCDIEGLRPYVREGDVVLFGYRYAGTPDVVDLERFERAAFVRHPLDHVRAREIAAALRPAVDRLESPDLGGFWIHVDVDVLDPALMPAVDSHDPGGMTFAELEETLILALASPRAAGMDFSIFDPDLDPDGALAERLVGLLERAVAGSQRFRRAIEP